MTERRDDLEVAASLIESALGDVQVVACPTCNGTGNVGRSSLPAMCPRCLGSGQTTITDTETPNGDAT